jgi:hypothetical protein
MVRTTLLALLLAGSLQQPRQPQRNDPAPPPQDVTVAELTSNPERYDQRVVRAKVQWVSLYHGPLACPLDNDKNCIPVNLDCPDDDACRPMQNMLTTNLEGVPLEDMRARFVVVGRVVHLKYASHNEAHFLLEVRKIESVLPKQSP